MSESADKETIQRLLLEIAKLREALAYYTKPEMEEVPYPPYAFAKWDASVARKALGGLASLDDSCGKIHEALTDAIKAAHAKLGAPVVRVKE